MKTSARLLLVVVASSALAKEPNSAVLGSGSTGDRNDEAAEARLRANFDASTEYSVLPTRGELLKDIELEGKWQSPGGFDSTSITFAKNLREAIRLNFQLRAVLGLGSCPEKPRMRVRL